MSVVAGQVRALAACWWSSEVAGAGSGPSERALGRGGRKWRPEDLGGDAWPSPGVPICVPAFVSRWPPAQGSPAAAPAPSPPSRASPGEVGIAIAPCPAPVAPPPDRPWPRGC